MYDRINGLSTPLAQAVEPGQSVDSDSFMETVADLALRRSPPPGDLPDMGCCASKPNVSDPNNPSTSGPVRPNAPLFEYRTAELADANVEGICVGLTAEWLGDLENSPRSRMSALTPGSDGHDSAAVWQQRYLDMRRDLRNEGAEPAQANSSAKYAMLQEAGLQPSQKEKVYTFDEPASISRMLGKISADGSRYLLSLEFVEGGRHTVATSTFDGRTTLFDPNYGEFSVPSHQVDSLLQGLADRYIDANGLHLKSIATRKMS
ncbi:YopT-type cysteine protease domain-containing protein [Bradyrhizobium sp. BWA-3-5]|uniref:YopT-type cysteine protease domain-containing protein n=1 Tax=Bradyrhizobium sp. BWA-3-5 TaxID=3080013 RepID=UPI00293F4763|nr:YopT-type cysteine protease domain-containing protein [Bradyrhizobium sp. BWA-3-5]WOH64014.1 YopT-type cysteine protease domain-containing protein [Bradyrhizobium sp. BWA-3-5]